MRLENLASRLLQIGRKLKKWKWRHNFLRDVIIKYFDVVLSLLPNLVTGPSFMPISSLALELWQFPFTRDWPEIQKSEIPPSEFFSISGDWGELGIPNLKRMSLIKFYRMLKNARVTAFTVFGLLMENQQGGGGGKIIHPTQIRVK